MLNRLRIHCSRVSVAPVRFQRLGRALSTGSQPKLVAKKESGVEEGKGRDEKKKEKSEQTTEKKTNFGKKMMYGAAALAGGAFLYHQAGNNFGCDGFNLLMSDNKTAFDAYKSVDYNNARKFVDQLIKLKGNRGQVGELLRYASQFGNDNFMIDVIMKLQYGGGDYQKVMDILRSELNTMVRIRTALSPQLGMNWIIHHEYTLYITDISAYCELLKHINKFNESLDVTMLKNVGTKLLVDSQHRSEMVNACLESGGIRNTLDFMVEGLKFKDVYAAKQFIKEDNYFKKLNCAIRSHNVETIETVRKIGFGDQKYENMMDDLLKTVQDDCPHDLIVYAADQSKSVTTEALCYFVGTIMFSKHSEKHLEEHMKSMQFLCTRYNLSELQFHYLLNRAISREHYNHDPHYRAFKQLLLLARMQQVEWDKQKLGDPKESVKVFDLNQHLMQSVKYMNYENFRILLENKADPNYVDGQGNSLMSEVIGLPDIRFAQLLATKYKVSLDGIKTSKNRLISAQDIKKLLSGKFKVTDPIVYADAQTREQADSVEEFDFRIRDIVEYYPLFRGKWRKCPELLNNAYNKRNLSVTKTMIENGAEISPEFIDKVIRNHDAQVLKWVMDRNVGITPAQQAAIVATSNPCMIKQYFSRNLVAEEHYNSIVEDRTKFMGKPYYSQQYRQTGHTFALLKEIHTKQNKFGVAKV